MSDTYTWLVIFWLTVATILTRSSFFLLGNAIKFPPRVQHALRYAPAAALAAIVVPDMLLSGGAVTISLANPKLLAGIGAMVFFVATQRLLGTIVVGMVLFSVVRLYF